MLPDEEAWNSRELNWFWGSGALCRNRNKTLPAMISLPNGSMGTDLKTATSSTDLAQEKI